MAANRRPRADLLLICREPGCRLHWLSNMHQHREVLVALVGEDYYRRFRTYLKLVRKTWNSAKMTVDAIVAYKI